MKKCIVFLFLMASSISFSQSKKEQIQQLTNRVDSLNQVLSSERIHYTEKLNELNSIILNLQSQLSSLNAITNQSAQTSQTGGYKSVKIGAQTWMTENLNVSTFRNGDPIPEAKTVEEWVKAGENKQPAWCYYDNDPKNGAKYGKLYNWFAVNDPRGFAPIGWHVPSDTEWKALSDYLGGEEVAGMKMKSSSGWNGYGCKRCDGGSSQFKANCTSCKGTQANSTDPLSGNGTNSSGFSGLPGGTRNYYGLFGNIGYYGYWWSSTENNISIYANYRYLHHYDDDYLTRGFNDKALGLSVRCLRD